MSNPHGTWWKWLLHELIIFTKFRKDWTKNADFLLMANFWTWALFWLRLYINIPISSWHFCFIKQLLVDSFCPRLYDSNTIAFSQTFYQPPMRPHLKIHVNNLRAKNNCMSKVEVRITPRKNHYWLALNSSCSARAATQFLSTSKLWMNFCTSRGI